MTSMEPFSRMVKMVARAFYEDISPKGDDRPKSSRGDSRGITVVVLDALTRTQWVREEDLAKALKLHYRQLRRILKFFEEEKLVRRCHRKEKAKGVKISSAASSTAGDVHPEGGENVKMHTHSYCYLDYVQIHDVVRYRILRMNKKLKDELDDRDTIQKYVCPNCEKRYSALDALHLVRYMDDSFHCEHCNGELLPENENLLLEELLYGGDNSRKHKHDKLKNMQERMEEQLKPLISQLDIVKDLPFPEFGSLQDWERVNNANGDNSRVGSSQSTPMPFFGEAKIEVVLSSSTGAQQEDVISGDQSEKAPLPWMRHGKDLEEEQKGEKSNNTELDQSSETKSDNNQCSEEDENKRIQDEYIKAYYEAIKKRQEEETKRRIQEDRSASISDQSFASDVFERHLGAKSKRYDDGDFGDDSIELKVDQQTGDAVEVYKKADLNVEAEQSGDDEDDIEWEED
ncbi:hypothetical protein GUJ93_ZPchr0011g28272 [Zizania palustris]|uniref:HTH TFE/IIEalpha-type domain-containing protein n=1 Tax=Zizania palustris TaxID=103762 RepID=A0A8J6BP59_ZIZPA|nr:hypothetical protein GUJ93_ZPchr0011g28272 [Zizania palustris]